MDFSRIFTFRFERCLIDRILTRANYDRRERPEYGAEAVRVNISAYVLNMPEVSFTKHRGALTLDMYFRQTWMDPRLRFPQDSKPSRFTKIKGGRELLEEIWVPDTFFVNELRSESLDTAVWIQDGRVKWSQRVRVTCTQLSAGQDFAAFPFDTQQFSLEIESFGYSAADLRYAWETEDSFILSPEITFYDFQLLGDKEEAIEVEM